MCQDTGLAIVFVEIGQDLHVVGGDLREAVNEGVRQGCAEGYLRTSVRDLLTGENTGDNGLYPRPGLKDIPVLISTIDAWFGNMDRPLDFLKIDVQGAECRVLRGAAETIRRNPTIVALVEYYPLGLRLAGASGQELIDLLLFNRLSVRDARRPLSDGLDHLPVYEKKKHTNLICFGPNAEVPREL
jgi:hypothetical protein